MVKVRMTCPVGTLVLTVGATVTDTVVPPGYVTPVDGFKVRVTLDNSRLFTAVATRDAVTDGALIAFDVTAIVPLRLAGVEEAAVTCTSIMQKVPGATGVAPVVSHPFCVAGVVENSVPFVPENVAAGVIDRGKFPMLKTSTSTGLLGTKGLT